MTSPTKLDLNVMLKLFLTAKNKIDNRTATCPMSNVNGKTDTLLSTGPQGVNFEQW